MHLHLKSVYFFRASVVRLMGKCTLVKRGQFKQNLLCVIKLEPTYSNPKSTFKISKIFEEWFYLFHPTTTMWVSVAEQEFKPRSPESSCITLSTTLHWVSRNYLELRKWCLSFFSTIFGTLGCIFSMECKHFSIKCWR